MAFEKSKHKTHLGQIVIVKTKEKKMFKETFFLFMRVKTVKLRKILGTY